MKTKIQLLMLATAAIAFSSCEKSAEPSVKEQSSVLTPEETTKNVRAFINDSRSNLNPDAPYSINHAIYMMEAATNYLYDANVEINNREMKTFSYPIITEKRKDLEIISSENVYAAFKKINEAMEALKLENKLILVADVEPVIQNNHTASLNVTVIYTDKSNQALRTAGICDPFPAINSYPLTPFTPNNPASANKQLEAKLDAYCLPYAPCPDNYSYYFTNVQTASGNAPSNGLWCVNAGNCSASMPTSVSGASLNTYRTNAVNWATAHQPANTDTKVDYNIFHIFNPCVLPSQAQQYWGMQVQYGLRVCYIPNN